MKMKWNNRNLDRIGRELAVQMNRTASMKVKGKSFTFQPVRLGILVLAALLAFVVLVNLLLIPSRLPRTVEMDFETGGNYTMIPMGNHLLMYNQQQLREVNTKGKTLWSLSIPMSHPIVETSKEYILVADLGGNNYAALYKNGQKLREYTLGNDIISAKVNPKGWTAFATATVGYKGKVTVFDKKGREKFTWNSGEGYILDIALDDKGRYLAVAQLCSDDKQANSRIQFIDLQRRRIVATAERVDSVIGELRFLENRLLAVSESELCGFKTSGKLAFSVSFAGKNPSKYDISGNQVFAFVTTDSLGNSVLELYNTNGKRKGQYRADNDIHSLRVADDMVVISRQRDVLYINSRGKLKKTATAPHDVKSLGLYGDGHTAFAAGNTAGYIVRMR